MSARCVEQRGDVAMGAEESKAHVKHDGDQHIEIINLQNEHSNKINRNTLHIIVDHSDSEYSATST